MPYSLTQKMNSYKFPLTCLFMADSAMPKNIVKIKAFIKRAHISLLSQKKQLNTLPNWRL